MTEDAWVANFRLGAEACRGKTYPVEILTPEEVRAMAAQCSTTTSYGIRNRALIVMLYRTGLRLGEVLALQPKDVNLEIGAVTVLHGKGDRMRTVGIDPGADPHIAAWLDRRVAIGLASDAPLFCSLQGRPLTGNTIRDTLRSLARRAGIDKRVHPHGFRHTHAYELMMEGVPIPIIQRQLGHASLATTDTYLAHIAPRQVIETMAKREWNP